MKPTANHDNLRYLYRSLLMLLVMPAVLLVRSAISVHSHPASAPLPTSAHAAANVAQATLFHPFFAKSNDVNSILYAHNPHVVDAIMEVTVLDQAGTAILVVTRSILAMSTAILDASTLTNLPSDSFTVRIDSNVELSTVMRTYTAETQALSLYRGMSADTNGTLYFGPFLKTNKEQSTLYLMNAGIANTTVTITARATDGTPTSPIFRTVAAQGFFAIAADMLTLPTDFTGWLQVEAAEPLVGLLAPIISQNNDGLYPPVAVVPNAQSQRVATSFTDFLPRVYNNSSQGNGQRTTEFFLGNLAVIEAAYNLAAYQANGGQVSSETGMIPTLGARRLQPTLLPNDFSGSTVIASSQALGVAAITKSTGGNPMASYHSETPQTTVLMPYISHGTDRYTFLSIQNGGTTDTMATAQFFDLTGTASISTTVGPIPVGASALIDTREYALGTDFVGSVVITSNQPIIAMVEEYVGRAISTPITGVAVSGPTVGQVNRSYTFTATVSPIDADTPISYAWLAEYPTMPQHFLQTSGVTTTVTMSFTTPGAKEITLEAWQTNDNRARTSQQVLITSDDSTTCANVTEIPQAECNALVDLYNKTNGFSWINKDGWLNTNTPCSWYGVSCENGHVNSIELDHNQLTGIIPIDLGNLTNLKKLDLQGNQLTGAIPDTLATMTKLEEVWLNDNPDNWLYSHMVWLAPQLAPTPPSRQSA